MILDNLLLVFFTLSAFVLLWRLQQALEREERMHNAIKKVCLQKLDDLCWLDFYDLAAAANVPMPDLKLLPKEVMLKNCQRYVDCLMKCPGDREQAAKVYHAAAIDKAAPTDL